jgi:hypothetical protein
MTGAIWGAVVCTPQGEIMDKRFLGSCLIEALRDGVYVGAVSIFDDIVISVLPLPVIARLQLPLRRKIALALVFFTGLL